MDSAAFTFIGSICGETIWTHLRSGNTINVLSHAKAQSKVK